MLDFIVLHAKEFGMSAFVQKIKFVHPANTERPYTVRQASCWSHLVENGDEHRRGPALPGLGPPESDSQVPGTHCGLG